MDRPVDERTEARAGDLLPDEEGSDLPEEQAGAILADSDDRQRRAGEFERRRSDDTTTP